MFFCFSTMEGLMDYKTLLVHLDLNSDNAGLLNVTAELAERFGARVVGIAAAHPIQPLVDEGFVMPDISTYDHAEIKRELSACRQQFEAALKGRARETAWRSAITFRSLAAYIADEARCADLIITPPDLGVALLDNSRRVDIGDLAFRAGRPVLIVPRGTKSLPFQQVFLAWKDGREARRAAADGLPLLKAAGHAIVLEVTSEDQAPAAEPHVRDVAAWLGQHGVRATPMAVGTKRLEAGYLHAELLDRKCDLLVAGAYGHNRLGEWIFGGVTQDVLLDPNFCVLLSH